MLLGPFTFLFLLASSLPVAVSSAPKSRRGKKKTEEIPPPSHDQMIDNIFPVLTVDPYKYEMNGIPFLTEELWSFIGSMLDPVSLWNFGLVCKHIGAIIRGPGGLNPLAKLFTPSEVLDLLYGSDIRIRTKHLELFKSFQNLSGMSVIKNDPVNYHSSGLITNLPYKRIIETFMPRTGDLPTIRSLSSESAFINFTLLVGAPESILQDLYRDYLYGKIYYLPEKEDSKLFDRIDPLDMGRLIWSDAHYTVYYRGCFRYSILADYVIPAWRGEHTLTELERSTIKELLVNTSSDYGDYFDILSWALFFVTGKKLKTEKTTIRPISSFLEGLGFQWDKITNMEGYRQQAESMLAGLDAIYAVAHQWKLDVNLIAKATPSNETSKVVALGFVPDMIKKMAAVTPRDIFILCQGDKLDSLEKVTVVGGNFVPEEGASRGVKRTRMLEDDVDDTSGVEGEPKKRRLSTHPLFIRDAQHPALNAGRIIFNPNMLPDTSLDASSILFRAFMNEQTFTARMAELYKAYQNKDSETIEEMPQTNYASMPLVGNAPLMPFAGDFPMMVGGFPMMPLVGGFPTMSMVGNIPMMPLIGPIPYMMQPGQTQGHPQFIPGVVPMDVMMQSIDPLAMMNFVGNPNIDQQRQAQMQFEYSQRFANGQHHMMHPSHP